MSQATLDGSNTRHDLGTNYFIRAPGIRGTAELQGARNVQAALRAPTPAGQETAEFDQALAAQDMSERASIVLSGIARSAPPPGVTLRSPSGEDALELETPDFGEGFDAVVLAKDEAGILTWHFPLAPDNSIQNPATRGPGKTRRFRIPRDPAPAPAPGTSPNRGLLAGVGRKVLKVLVYPITDPIFGAATDAIAGLWEKKHRPYALRTVTPDNYLAPLRLNGSDTGVVPLSRDDAGEWQRLSAGRALLFVHGTFSTTHGGFGGLPLAVMQELATRYGGRVIGFDHPSLSHDPRRNVAEFFEHVPAGTTLDVDIVCHSRGGLVSRELDQAGRPDLKVGRIVFVGVPNAGTALADPNHMVSMIDRLTSALNLLPDGTLSTVLESLLTAVKVIGRGGLKSLDGLAAMNPTGAYLPALAAGTQGGATYVAITADYEPTDTAFGSLVLNGAVDRIFENARNDLVVPTDGVFQANAPSFPIPVASLLKIAPSNGVLHTTYFRHQPVHEALLRWLKG